MKTLAAIVSALLCAVAWGKTVQKPVAYQQGGANLEGVLIYDDAVKGARPGLVLVPNWLGINENNLKQASEIAGQKYVVFVADMFGKAARPKNDAEAMKAVGPILGNRPLMRQRVAKALEVLHAQGRAAGMDPAKVGAVGFCFGGTSALELAKSGAEIKGVVAFHAGLDAKAPISGSLKARVLALQGANDPFEKPEDLQAFTDDLKKANADWTLVEFGGAVHGFTDPTANKKGQLEYNPTVTRRAYQMMDAFFAETFGT